MKSTNFLFPISILLLSACSSYSSNNNTVAQKTPQKKISQPALPDTKKENRVVDYTIRIYDLQRHMTSAERQTFRDTLKYQLDNVFHMKYTDNTEAFSSRTGQFVVTASKKSDFQDKLENLIAQQIPVTMQKITVSTITKSPAVTTMTNAITLNSESIMVIPQTVNSNWVKTYIEVNVATPSIFKTITQTMTLPSGSTALFMSNRENSKSTVEIGKRDYIIAVSPTVNDIN